VKRPSSHTRPRAPSGLSNSVANACCVIVPSGGGRNDFAQVLPPSFEYASRRLDPSNSSLLDCIQSATRVPFERRRTDGVSASVTNQSSPDATLTGGVQPFAARSANLSVAPSSPDSSQLTSATPFFDTL